MSTTSAQQDERGAGYPEPLSEFREGQWWVKELDAMVRQNATDDQKRAVAVVHHMLLSAAQQVQAEGEAVAWMHDELRLIQSILNGFQPCVAKADGLRAVNKLLAATDARIAALSAASVQQGERGAEVWGLRIGDSDVWGYTPSEADADFLGKQSGLPYEKRRYVAAQQIQAEGASTGALPEPAHFVWREYAGENFMPDGHVYRYACHRSTGPKDTQVGLYTEDQVRALLAVSPAKENSK